MSLYIRIYEYIVNLRTGRPGYSGDQTQIAGGGTTGISAARAYWSDPEKLGCGVQGSNCINATGLFFMVP